MVNKKVFSFCVAAGLAALQMASAQRIHFGLKGGPEFGKVSGKAFTSSYRAGYQLGAFAEIGFKKWAIQPEVLFSQTNTKTVDESALNNANASALVPSYKAKLNSLFVPIMINYRLLPILDLQFGPQFEVATSKASGLTNEVKSAFKSGAVDAAAGLQLRISKFRAYGRYYIGLTGVKNSELDNVVENQSWHRQAFQFGVGFTIL